MTDLSWPHVSGIDRTPEQRAEAALNLALGRMPHSGFTLQVIANAIREAVEDAEVMSFAEKYK